MLYVVVASVLCPSASRSRAVRQTAKMCTHCHPSHRSRHRHHRHLFCARTQHHVSCASALTLVLRPAVLRPAGSRESDRGWRVRPRVPRARGPSSSLAAFQSVLHIAVLHVCTVPCTPTDTDTPDPHPWHTAHTPSPPPTHCTAARTVFFFLNLFRHARLAPLLFLCSFSLCSRALWSGSAAAASRHRAIASL